MKSVLLLIVGLLPGALAQEWVDRGEYDLALQVRAESSAAERLELIGQWRKKYPQSRMQQMARELALDAAQQLGDPVRILTYARELFAQDRQHYSGSYWITILTPAAAGLKPDPADLEQVTAAARVLLASLEKWPKQKNEVTAAAHRALGWAAWRRGQTDEAGRELSASLTVSPRNGEVSAWYGTLLVSKREPLKLEEGIWHLARAAYLDGEGSLPAAQRRDVRALLEAAYVSHHGGLDGLDAVGLSAASATDATLPPAAFRIETAAEAAQRKADEAMATQQPQMWTWVQLRRRLAGPGGMDAYEKLASPDAAPLPQLKGWVIRCDKDRRPTQVFLGLQDTVNEEVVLRLETPAKRCPDAGIAVEFLGKPVAFTPEPFQFTVTAPWSNVRGWPEELLGQ